MSLGYCTACGKQLKDGEAKLIREREGIKVVCQACYDVLEPPRKPLGKLRK